MTSSMRSAEHFYKRFLAFPRDSARRLEHINRTTSSAHHVLLAIKYGVTDLHIRALNRTIVSLLLSRLRAERDRNQRVLNRINETMLGLHLAIDWITGVQPPFSVQYIDRSTCNRVPGSHRKQP
jgi:hypothetical protein